MLAASFGYEQLYYMVLDEHECLRAILPLVVARDLSMKKVGVSLPFINYLDICSDGTVDETELIGLLEQIQQCHRLKYLQIRLRESNAPAVWQMQKDNYVFLLPTAGSLEEIMALSTSDNRNHTRKTLKKNYFSVSFDKAYLADFYKVYCTRMHELGSPSPKLSFFENFLAFCPEQTYLLTVLDQSNDKIVGGMILLADPERRILHYPYGSCLVRYNSKYINNFMYWEAVKLAKELEMEYLDLGRSPLDSGTYRYKKHWGALPQQLSYCLYSGGRQVALPDKENMSLFIKIWQILPAWVVNFVGRRIIKYVLP